MSGLLSYGKAIKAAQESKLRENLRKLRAKERHAHKDPGHPAWAKDEDKRKAMGELQRISQTTDEAERTKLYKCVWSIFDRGSFARPTYRGSHCGNAVGHRRQYYVGEVSRQGL